MHGSKAIAIGAIIALSGEKRPQQHQRGGCMPAIGGYPCSDAPYSRPSRCALTHTHTSMPCCSNKLSDSGFSPLLFFQISGSPPSRPMMPYTCMHTKIECPNGKSQNQEQGQTFFLLLLPFFHSHPALSPGSSSSFPPPSLPLSDSPSLCFPPCFSFPLYTGAEAFTAPFVPALVYQGSLPSHTPPPTPLLSPLSPHPLSLLSPFSSPSSYKFLSFDIQIFYHIFRPLHLFTASVIRGRDHTHIEVGAAVLQGS